MQGQIKKNQWLTSSTIYKFSKSNKDIFEAWQKGLEESSKKALVKRQVAEKGDRLYFDFKEHYEKLIALPRRVRRAMQRKWKHSLAGVALLLALGAGPAMAGTTINVNGGNVADLIQAINDANSEVVPFDGADTIILDGSTFTLDAIDNGVNGLPVITTEIIIEGNGSTIEREATAADFRIFLVDGEGGDNGNLTLQNTTVSGGVANSGGGIFNYDGTTTITNSTISGNSASGDGGGIFNNNILTITNSTISGNDALDGGGVYNFDVSTSTITNSTISGNTAINDGGGIFGNDNYITITDSTISGNSADDRGGGIFNAGDLTLTNSTLTGNSVVDAGGGVYNAEILAITNSTISGNNQTGLASTLGGAGLASEGTLTINNSTITDNNAVAPAAVVASGITTFGSAVTTVTGSIVADQQTGTDCGTFDFTDITSNGGNIESGTSCNFTNVAMGDLQNTDPLLGPLADNGGFTQTHALVIGSPAIDAILPANCPPPATDQRGVTRPQGDSCDAGSFELSEVSIMPGAGNVFASISLDPTIAGGGGQVIIDLPPEVQAEAAQLDPNAGNCDIQTTTVTCNVENFPENLDLIVDLCRDGDQQGTVDAIVEVLLDDEPGETFENIIQILLNQLQACQADGTSGCTIAPRDKTSTSNSLSNFLVTLIPAVFGFVGLFRRRRKKY